MPVFSEQGKACFEYDLTSLASDPTIYTRKDSYPDTYLVSAPCRTIPLPQPACKNTSCPVLMSSSLYQLYPSNSGCISCGDPTTATPSLLDASDLQAGLKLKYTGGNVCPGVSSPREMAFYLVCNQSAPADLGPEQLILTGTADEYVVVWQTPYACPRSVPATACPAPAVPKPTAPQLQWQKLEIGVIIHFNMATMAHSQGCSGTQAPPPASSFNPTAPNFTAQWAQSMVDLGAAYAVYVAKHGCGFATWPTRVAFPEFGFTYNYSVAASPFRGDVVGSFVRDARAAGVRVGFYYSVVSNAFLRVDSGTVHPDAPLGPTQANVTQAQYEQIVLAQLAELWGNYGDLEEIWFDGGYQQSIKSNLTNLLVRLQPNAVAFGGFGASPNPVRWCGTEAGAADYPNWSTGPDGGGDPNSPYWCPAEVDTTLQNFDQWFYNPTAGLRSLDVLKGVYHNSVGRNGNLLLDFAPQPDGLLPPDAVQRYKEFGDWIRSCYGRPLASTQGVGFSFVIALPAPTAVDRIVIQEDQAYGELVRAYSVAALVDGSWQDVSSGSAVGNKRIDVWKQAVVASAVRLTFTSMVDVPHLAFAGVYDPSKC